jgi:hypothetical protein
MGVYKGIAQDNATINGGTLYNVNLTGTTQIGGVNLTATAAEINATCDTSARLVSATAATLAVTVADHDGKTVVLNRAAGVTATLPAATGSGAIFNFTVGTAVTSNNNIIKVADNTDVFSGVVAIGKPSDGSVSAFSTAAASDTLTMNGSTTGGLVGGMVSFVDIAADTYAVFGDIIGSGSLATPFSATV